jgi:hypothetical protein
MAEIYGLYSAQDGNVRYVGQTGGTRARRFERHKSQMWFDSPSLSKWVHTEWRHGYPVECALLQWCDYDERHDVETEWIRNFPKLLNKRKVGQSYRGGRPPVPREIKDYIRGHSFNHEGHVGVHYSKIWDRFSVLFYTGS